MTLLLSSSFKIHASHTWMFQRMKFKSAVESIIIFHHFPSSFRLMKSFNIAQSEIMSGPLFS